MDTLINNQATQIRTAPGPECMCRDLETQTVDANINPVLDNCNVTFYTSWI